jgi:hypothetical protein
MRTTVDLDSDVLQAVKELARARGETFGRTLSDAARKGLLGVTDNRTTGALAARDSAAEDALSRLGFEPIPSGGSLVTNTLVDEIRDEEGL